MLSNYPAPWTFSNHTTRQSAAWTGHGSAIGSTITSASTRAWSWIISTWKTCSDWFSSKGKAKTGSHSSDDLSAALFRPKGADSGKPSSGNKRLESDVERKILLKAKSMGMLSYKFSSPSKRAVPDRIFIAKTVYGASVGWLEVKRPGEYPTPLQERELRIMRKQGCLVAWTDNLDDAIHFLKVLQAS